MRDKLKRCTSIILCVVMIVTAIPCIPGIFAAAVTGTDSVTTTDIEFHDGIDYELTRTTRYIGNRTYSVQMDISADLSTFEHARIRTASRNGYVTIQETGYYLLELWGGDGGDGQMGITHLFIPTPGGTGASGGYVYGKVFLKAGQTLVYNIGTNGDESTVLDDAGGGVNGDGGTHGDMGSYTVGGGGGYTAIYLFEENEFKESYVSETSINIPETARLSRYLMIAGGGGGGGAGLTNLLINGTASAPNGGTGGSINNGVSMSLRGNDYVVPGYVFSGRNGQSSGTSTEYIGRGGSNVPGQISETLMGSFKQTQLPNDWTGTHNPLAKPGAGGSGNFRGGGGGSGYAGGSGGLMAAQLVAAHIGGGGGGSSFIAETVNDQEIVFQELTAAERAYLSGASAQPVGGTTGGAVQITYLSGAEDEFYQEALDDISISATVSRYFDVLDSSKATESGKITTTINADSTTYVKATGLSIIPASPAHGGKTATVTIFVRAKEGFLGGNSVPLIDGVSADFLSPNDLVTPIHIVPTNLKAHRYVNVPLNATIRTNSYTSSQKGKSYAVTSLYEDDYASARDSLTSYWEYDHISAISTYRVYQNGTQVTSSVAPNETTTYEVKYDVTPLISADAEITVGPAVESPTTITGKAVISVVAPGTAVLNGLNVTGSKNLSYANGKYDFSVLINQSSPTVMLENSKTSTTTSGEWFAPVDGWYYIQAWGGNGGSSGSVSCSGVNGNDVRTAAAGTGGTGGYVYGYVYLAQNQSLSLTIGSAGATGASNTGNRLARANSLTSSRHEVHQSHAGGGGGYTAVLLDGSPLLVAGGGGGAGSSTLTIAQWAVVYSQSASRNGGSVSSSVSSTLAASLGSYSGSSGSRNGSGSASQVLGVPSNMTATAGSAGSAGANYRLTGLSSGYDTTSSGNVLPIEAEKYASQQASSKSGRSGQVAITLVATEDSQSAYDKLMDVESEIAISRYFDIEKIEFATGDKYSTSTSTDNGDGSFTKVYKNSSGNQVAKFSYRIVTAADGVSSYVKVYDVEYIPDPVTVTEGSKYYLHYESTLDFTLTLKPKEGFLGGNDVPVLAYGQTGGVADKDSIPDNGVRVTQGTEFMNLPAANPTDFANVEHNVDMSKYLTVQDKTIHLGQSVQKTELYTFEPPTYGASDWQDDYATFVSPENETYSPTQTTNYTITAGFAPRIENAQKATIVESLPVQNYSLESTVYVEVPVNTTLTNLTCDNVDWTLWGESFGCTISPKAGYILPEEIEVTINGEKTSDYTYNSSVGTVSIEGQYVTGPIVISAKAAVKTYDIHIVYNNYDENLKIDVPQPEIVITGIVADETIDWSRLNEIKGTINAKEGYNYQWVFETSDGKQPTTMPAKNLWVYGSYEKASYPLTINYVKQVGETTESISTYQTEVVYGEEYAVISPAIKGYLPDQTVVSGTMGVSAVTVTVTYTASQNKLIILYQKESDGTLLNKYEQDTVTGETYTVDSPEIEGYETDTPVVTITMEGDDTQTVIVKYKPKKYTVTFDYTSGGYGDATLDGANTKLVEYDNIYAYNATDKVYDGLPTAQMAGYTFAGWYKDAQHTTAVKESDTVKITADTTFYAKWERTKYKLTVRYEFLYEEGDYIPEEFGSVEAVRASLKDNVIEVPYGDNYSVTLPTLNGYSAYENFGLNDQEKLVTLSGKMPGQNKLVVISYEINTYEIKFMDLAGSHVSYSDADTSTVAEDTFNTTWKTVYVKHNIAPVYEESDATPNHATREEYTYNFTGWYGSNDGVAYSGKTPEFPVATSERDYYAMYTATENIVAVNYGSKVEYFTDVASAVEFAETNMASSPTMKFRRNDGNGSIVDVSEDRVILGDTYAGTTLYTLTIDLNGCTLASTQGEAAIENNHKYMALTITDTAGNGSIDVSGAGDVVAIDVDARNVTINKAITVNATSTDGNATAIRMGANTATTYLYLQAAINISASAPNGTAIGIEVLDSSYTFNINPTMLSTVKANGNNAVGIDIKGATASISSTMLAMDIDGTEQAIGILVEEEGTLTNGSKLANELKVTSNGQAFGIWNKGTISSLNTANLLVDAAGNAYGIYNDGGIITVSGITTNVNVIATSTGGQGYGLYNVEGKTKIGDEENSQFLNKGAFAGSSYGIYSEDDSIYASGNALYFKGADAESAMDGVVYKKYQETDATTQFAEGYYRLAMERTIKFVTNGGTEIAEIKQLYDTPLTVPKTTRLGYTFVGWYQDEELTSVYNIPVTMPDADITLYANWDIIVYKYALDQEFKEYTVKFYKNRNSTDEELFGTVKVTKDNPILEVPVTDPTYQSGTTLYVFNGWYTQRTDTAATYVTLNGNLSDLDKDGNGIIELYAGWENMASNANFVAFDTNAAQAYVTDSHTSSNVYRMYFVVPLDGDYSVSVGNVGGTTQSYRKDLRIYTYKHGTKSSEFVNSWTNYKSSLSYVNYNSSGYSGLRGLKAGDVLVVQLYRSTSGSSYNSTTYAKISGTPAGYENVKDYQATSSVGMNILHYTVEDGDNGVVTLPIAEKTGHEGKRFAGWADTENAPSTEWIMQLTPDMVDTVPEWQNGEVWQLYSQWDESRWGAYSSDHRDFTDFNTTQKVTIDKDETVSLRFKTDINVEDSVAFKFKNGLPKGTILTLIDRSGSTPKYYTYTVTEDATKEIVSSKFAEMGKSGQKFDGKSEDIVLQICYTNAKVTVTEEEVSLYMGEITSETEVVYGLKLDNVAETILAAVTSKYNETYTSTISVPALQGNATDKVFLRILWEGDTLAPGALFTIDDQTAVVYDGKYAKISLGTVADFATTKNLTLTSDLTTMMQNEFANKKFIYEICTVSQDTEKAVVFGSDVDVVARITQSVTITESDILAITDLSTRSTIQGGTINIGTITLNGTETGDVEMQLLAMNDEGKLISNAGCLTLFDSANIAVAADGKLTAVSGSLVNNGVFQASILSTATTGKYYLKVIHEDKYIIVPIRIREAN